MGLKVTMIKIDPYINVDAGTMAPTEHGEIFVLDDGGEVDLDLGNYERYMGITLTRANNITTGKIYQNVIERERRGDYLGQTVQVVPHITNVIGEWIWQAARIPVDETQEKPDICIIELGGTVGDIENAPFVEALGQLRRRVGKDNFLHVHVSLVPVINGEQKTKPTQQTIKAVRSIGLNPDLVSNPTLPTPVSTADSIKIACRCKDLLEISTTDKVAMFCQVEPEQVFAVHDVTSTYYVPLVLEEQGLKVSLSKMLQLDLLNISPRLIKRGTDTWDAWKTLTTSQGQFHENVTIVLVGKYTSFIDSYMSVVKSLEHAAMACQRNIKIVLVDAYHLEKDTTPEYLKAWEAMHGADGFILPGGFGSRGIEGMIAAAKWARESKKPYLGVCLGMQIAVIEFAQNVCNIPGAGSVEWDVRSPDPVIISMPEIDRSNLGGTMRLGIKATHFQPGSEWSKLRALYGLFTYDICSLSESANISLDPPYQSPHTPDFIRSINSTPIRPQVSTKELVIHERHRHRYEVNPSYISTLATHGLSFIGKDDSGERMEILELKDHPWFVGVQFHPEYLSRVLEPSKPYLGFVAASAGCLDDIIEKNLGK